MRLPSDYYKQVRSWRCCSIRLDGTRISSLEIPLCEGLEGARVVQITEGGGLAFGMCGGGGGLRPCRRVQASHSPFSTFTTRDVG